MVQHIVSTRTSKLPPHRTASWVRKLLDKLPVGNWGLQAGAWAPKPGLAPTGEVGSAGAALRHPSRVPVVQVELQGSWDESFHRYMSAGLTPCLRVLGLVLKAGEAEKGVSFTGGYVLIRGVWLWTCPELQAESPPVGVPVPTV